VWIRCGGNTVSKFAPGATNASATLIGLTAPLALAFDGAGNLFVANQAVNTVSRFAPDATTPSATLTGLDAPRALAFDSTGNLFVANTGGPTDEGTTVSKFAKDALAQLTAAPSATLTGLNLPVALAFDSAGNLYVGKLIGTTVSKFVPGATTASATLTGLNGPVALAFDSAGNLFVANKTGNTVSKFAVSVDIKVKADSGAFSRPAQASQISPGPAGESSQTVSFTVANDNPDLFSAPPAIANNGELTFTPASGQSGIATVTVTAVDSLGAASTAQTFKITVLGTACPINELLSSGPTAPQSLSPQSLGLRVAADVVPPISLATFHALEGLLGESLQGQRLKDLYRAHGTEIVQIMRSQPALRAQMTSVMTSFQPAVVALLSGRAQQAQITQAMTDQLNTMWTTMGTFASPTLAQTLNTERSRFNGFQDFVGRDFSQWAGMLQVPSPTDPRVQISKVSSSNGQLSLEANAVDGWDVVLWGTTDLKNWSPVPGAVRQTNGFSLWLTDPNPTQVRRFYRLQTGP
jgi:hypothetical protein